MILGTPASPALCDLPAAGTQGHQHGTDLPGHERHRQGEKERDEKLCLNCQRVFLCPPLQVWALKSLPGGVLYVLSRWECEHGKG